MKIKRNLKNAAGILLVTAVLMAISVMSVSASAPANDNFADATLVTGLPFSDSSNTSEASIEPGDPWTCVGQYKSIWYMYTPESDASLNISTSTDPNYAVTLVIYDVKDGVLTQLSCLDWQQVSTDLDITAGTTYYFELMARYQPGPYPPPEPPEPPADPDGGFVTIDISQNLPPANDNFSNATVIQETPFTDSVDITFATTEAGEPYACGWYFQRTVWYSFTPVTSGSYKIKSSGYESETLAVYTGSNINDLQVIDCRTDWYETQVILFLEGGITYYFQTFEDFPGQITIEVTPIYPPANDNFSNATLIPGIPFSDSVDRTIATTEPGEPSACGWNLQQSLWYSFTPGTSGAYTAESSGGNYPVLAIYTGTDLSSLQTVDCRIGWGSPALATLILNAGTTYYFQTFPSYSWEDPHTNFSLYLPPTPEAYFNYWPGDPMAYESIQFSNDSVDPGGAGFETCAWDFGDGSTATDCYPVHQYSDDGDYTVQLATTTFDGRSASTSQTVQVRTHDVGITRLVTPTSARVGQTRSISIYVKNLYYPETVQVDLYRSTLNGYEWIGSLTAEVPVRPANRPQEFAFTYTFTSQDGDIGKVNFKVVAMIINSREIFMADNERVSFATRVTR